VNTDELVSLLATGVEPVEPRARARAVLLVLLAGVAAAGALMTALLGIAPALLQEARLPQFWVRECFCAALAAIGLVCVRRLAHPGVRLGLAPAALAAPVVLMCLLAVVVLVDAGSGRRLALVLGQTASVCSVLIALVSAPVFAAVVWAMRRYAPTRLRLSGAAAGLASGGVGALVYTLHCPELAPPFLAVWYVLGMLIPAAAGALLGPRLLRW
jgi:hypothetical protein